MQPSLIKLITKSSSNNIIDTCVNIIIEIKTDGQNGPKHGLRLKHKHNILFLNWADPKTVIPFELRGLSSFKSYPPPHISFEEP